MNVTGALVLIKEVEALLTKISVQSARERSALFLPTSWTKN